MDSNMGFSENLAGDIHLIMAYYDQFRHLCNNKEQEYGDMLEKISHLKWEIEDLETTISGMNEHYEELKVRKDLFKEKAIDLEKQIESINARWYNRLYVFVTSIRFRSPITAK